MKARVAGVGSLSDAETVAATRAAADRGRPGDVYNLGGGPRVSINRVLESIP